MTRSNLLLTAAIAASALVGLNAQAIDSNYRAKLEKSGCTQVSEMQGCDLNKTKVQNQKLGFGLAFCGGGGVKRRIEYTIMENSKEPLNATVTVNGETQKAMTSYSFFGNAAPPKGFVVAILPENQSGPEFLVFRDAGKDWIEYGDYQYTPCQ